MVARAVLSFVALFGAAHAFQLGTPVRHGLSSSSSPLLRTCLHRSASSSAPTVSPRLRSLRMADEARAVGSRDSGRHMEDTSERSEAVSDIYKPFWEWAAKTIKERLGDDLVSYPIPDGYLRKEAMVGKGKRESLAWTQSYGYQTKKMRQIRAAHVNGGASLQVLNLVFFPHMNYDLPFLGLDLVTLPGGHLIAIDMQPLFQTEEYKKKYAEPCMDMYQKHVKNLPWGGDFPEEAKQYFSPVFLWTRPQEDKQVETYVFEAFKDYINKYLDFVEAAKPVTDPDHLARIRERQLSYLQYRAEKDPARGMFTRMYGPEWTERYIHGFLFDLEEKMESGEYKTGELLQCSDPLNFQPTPL
uniref:Ferredoxin oxidoreductase n=1 Tax=Guillardia theta TaxID=55529 RepID=Q5K291_GUITH|nr:ferredoxin oxidoreductase precursor [Guillardia theta]